jgi:S1-C subfamily serine protease
MSASYTLYPEMPEPPMPPAPRRRRHIVGLSVTAIAALAIGAGVGTVAYAHSSGNGNATATSTTVLTTSQIASRVDPSLVDVISTLGYEKATAEGTGIVLTSTGEILTNNHVIEGATSIKVRDVGNGKTYTAKVVGYNETDDVAVIQLEDASGLTVANLGNSDSATVGSKVVGLGNAGGGNSTPVVATGDITALDQSITASDESSGTTEDLTGMIEDNDDIQAGDSGGALVNAYGQIIGMNTAAESGYSLGDGDNGGSQYGNGEYGDGSSSSSDSTDTQGFAIPIDRALSIADEIEAGDSSSTVHIGATAFIGVGLETEDSSSDGSGFGGGSTTSGVYVEDVEPDSPAATAGLTGGDTITSVAGQTVTAESQVTSILEKYHPGDKISISWTDESGSSHTATITLATGPSA